MRDLRELDTYCSKRVDGDDHNHEIKLPMTLLATAGYDNRIFLWHPETGDIYKEYEHQLESQVNCLKFSTDGKYLAVTGYEVLRVYDVHSNSPLTNMSNNLDSNKFAKNLMCVGFNKSDPTSLVTGGEDGCCRLWEFPRRNLKNTKEINCSKFGVINCLSMKHPTFIAIVATQLGYILGWNVTENTAIILYHNKTLNLQSIDCHAGDNIRIVGMASNGYLLHYYADKWTERRAHDRYGLRCVISTDGRLLATGGADGKIKLFSLEKENIFELHQFCDNILKWVWDLQFTVDARYLFVASSQGVVQMWSMKDKTIKRSYRGHQKSVVSLALFQKIP